MISDTKEFIERKHLKEKVEPKILLYEPEYILFYRYCRKHKIAVFILTAFLLISFNAYYFLNSHFESTVRITSNGSIEQPSLLDDNVVTVALKESASYNRISQIVYSDELMDYI